MYLNLKAGALLRPSLSTPSPEAQIKPLYKRVHFGLIMCGELKTQGRGWQGDVGNPASPFARQMNGDRTRRVVDGDDIVVDPPVPVSRDGREGAVELTVREPHVFSDDNRHGESDSSRRQRAEKRRIHRHGKWSCDRDFPVR